MSKESVLVSGHFFIFVSTVTPISHGNGEGIFLVTSHVSITHEIENVLLCTRVGRSSEVQFDTRLVLKSQPLDCNKAEIRT